VLPSGFLPRLLGNTYTSSLYTGLLSLLLTTPHIQNKSALLFSYGSGLCSTMMTVKIH
jgi:3-hydroxy-3-methylglutaryl CoA synthase